ncbi:MAG: ester cyclase [Rubrobacter sp.]|nr:ester cyclase [Rubrobacter sp.]
MTNEENKVLVRRYIEEVWNARDVSAVERFFAPDYVRRLSPTESLDAAGQKERIEGFLAAFPDIRFEIGDVFGEGGLVTFRATIFGTHEGGFAGVAPTGRRIRVSLIDVVRVEGGRFAEHWGGPDMLDLMRHIEAEASPE